MVGFEFSVCSLLLTVHCSLLSTAASYRFEPRPGRWVGLEMQLELLASILCTKRTAREFPLRRARSYLTTRAAGEQPAHIRPAAVTVGDILGMQVHTVLFCAEAGDLTPHRLLFGPVLLQSRLMNRAAPAIKAAVCYHCIHNIHRWRLGLAHTGTTERFFLHEQIA